MRPPLFFLHVRLVVCLCLLLFVRASVAQTPFTLVDGDRVVFLGDTLIEREQYSGWLELMLTSRFADRNLTFRNLGWSADTPAGDSRFGLSLLQAGREPADEGWTQLLRQIEEARPTVMFVGYGMASSFDGEGGLPAFRANYRRLLDAIQERVPEVRFVLLSPLPHENLGPPWPDPSAHNASLAAYAAAVADLAIERNARHLPLFDLVRARSGASLTDNGIHLHAQGYRILAEIIEDSLVGASPTAPAWRTHPGAEPLRQAILRKNEWFFHRSRPANMAYIFGFRKHEQGNNATEVLQFDSFIAAEENRITQLRSLRPVHVPEIPRHRENLTARFTPQPLPQFEVAEGFEVTLWAENPLLHKPVQMNFDARGRLWIASSEMYPQIEPGQEPIDQIIILEDTTGGGRADRATVFAEGLLIPTGLEPGDGGVYVGQSTELLHFSDTNGDGKADVRRTVLSGFGTEDTHHNLHTLRWGPDGRLYINQAVYTRTGTETPHGVVRLKAGGVFRFDPRDQRLDIVYRGFTNSWGHQFDEHGQSFLTDGAGDQGISWGVDGATYRTLAPFRRVLSTISPGTYPKFCGIEIIHSAHFPADWQGDIITADFRAHRIVRFKRSDQGAGFETREMPDVLRTTSDSFRPIDVRLGPDGALYIADWSNPIIQHGEVDFRDPRRDKSHGRIWRVAAKGRPALPIVNFTELANTELFECLIGPNAYDQERATRVLVERGEGRVLADLDAWTAALASGREWARYRALFIYRAFDRAPSELVNSLLAARDPDVRAGTVRALPSDRTALVPLEKLVADEHPRVRLEAVRALGRHASAEAATLALSVLDRPMDSFLDYALWLTVNDLAAPWVAAVKDGIWDPEGRSHHLEFALKSVESALAADILGQLLAKRGLPRDGSGPWIELIGTAGGPQELRTLFDLVRGGDGPSAVRKRALEALADAARLRNATPSGAPEDLVALLSSNDDSLRAAAFSLAGAWKLTAAVVPLARAVAASETPPALRSAGFAALRDIGGAPATREVAILATGGASPEIRREAVVVLASLDLDAAVSPIIAVLRETTDETQAQALWRALLGVRAVGPRLAEELAKVDLPPELAQAGLRPAREGNRHPALVSALLEHAGLALSSVELSAEEMQAFAQEALLKGDAVRGELIYRRPELACVACHAIGGAGGKLGPDLTSIGASAPPDYLVDSMLYPNAKIKEGYHAVSIATKSGQELSGMIIRETATEVRLRDAANQETSIAVNDIARRTNIGSLMPAGLMDGLVPEERLDLIKFLAMLGKPGDFDAARGGVARLWHLYFVTSRNEHVGTERVVQGDPALTGWLPTYTLVNGALPAESVRQSAPPDKDRPWFAATRFEASRPGSATFRWEGVAKRLWVNGVAVTLGAEFSSEVKAGVNVVVVEFDNHNITDFRLTSDDVSFGEI